MNDIFADLVPLNLNELAPEVMAMLNRIAHALHKASPGGRQITAAEWAEIGKEARAVAPPYDST